MEDRKFTAAPNVRLEALNSRAGSDLVVRRALRLFEAEPNAPWTVQRLARELGISRASLQRRFRAAFGAPPLRVLREVRLRRAAELLRTADAGLAAIAVEVGYDSEFSLSRAFLRWAGVRPGQYRRSHREPTRCLAA